VTEQNWQNCEKQTKKGAFLTCLTYSGVLPTTKTKDSFA